MNKPTKFQILEPFVGSSGHQFLDKNDPCIFLGEWVSGGGFNKGLNQLIVNFKKMKSSNPLEKNYQQSAVNIVCEHFCSLKIEAPQTSFIPVPPSKLPEHPDFKPGSRMLGECLKRRIAIRYEPELLTRRSSREEKHKSTGPRSRPELEKDQLQIRTELLPEKPKLVIIFDDVVTSGSSFKASKLLVQEHLPDVPILGAFIGRTSTIPCEFL